MRAPRIDAVYMLVLLASVMTMSIKSVCAEDAPKIETQAAVPTWPRPCVLIPELPKPPVLDGALEDAQWGPARRMELRFRGNSNKPEIPDAYFRAAHCNGTLYLALEIDWPGDAAPRTDAKDRDGAIWEDDGAEIFLVPADDLAKPRQMLFNLAGVKGELMHTYDVAAEKPIKNDAAWHPAWEVKCQKDGKRWLARAAIPLKEVLGLEGKVGEVFRFDLVCNRPKHAAPDLHWCPVLGERNNRPAFFGFAVLTSADPGALEAKDLKLKAPADAVVVEAPPASTLLLGDPFQLTLLNPLAGAVKGGFPISVNATLHRADAKDRGAVQKIALEGAALKVTTTQPDAQEGAWVFELTSDAGELKRFQIQWRRFYWVDAADPLAVSVEGKSATDIFPRSIGRQIRGLRPGAKLTLTCNARALYLRFPVLFASPGPYYGDWSAGRLRAQIDGGAWKEYASAEFGRVAPLVEDLPPGTHTVVLEPVGGNAALESIGVASEALSELHGAILGEYAELLTDVRAEIYAGENLVRSEVVRAPQNGRFEILGLVPGKYRVRFVAAGWLPQEIKEALITKPGQKVDLGALYLRRQPGFNGMVGSESPAYGRTVNAQPDAEISIRMHFWAEKVKKAELVSRFKTIALEIKAQELEKFGRWNDVGRVTLKLPKDVPFDMYALRYTFASPRGDFNYSVPQAVCVRAPIEGEFMLAGCGHMNTWGQETAEYLAKVAGVAELSGVRTFLIANEVNAAYLSGTLADLRIPYVVTRGNHTVGRWEDFFPAGSVAYDDGPMRLVTHARYPYESWAEPEARLLERPDAKVRALLCFEAYAPIALIKQAQVKLLFDGHSDDPHPNEKDFPPHTIHTRAPTQETLRFIPLTPDGFPERVKSEQDLPLMEIPRKGPAPLRVEWSAPNDGSAVELTGTLRNDTELPFPSARMRMVLKAGKYDVTDGKVIQTFNSDDGKFTVIDVEAPVTAHASTVIAAKAAP